LHKPGEMIPVFVLLGSNIEPEMNVVRAVKMLKQNYHLHLRAASRVYESAPINAAGEITAAQANFLNAALLVETDYYTPYRFKYEVLRFVEQCLGRKRTSDRFAPRTIDLDIALFGDQVIETSFMTVPDPDILRKAHVARPLADVQPDFLHPVTGQQLATVANAFADSEGIAIREDISLSALLSPFDLQD
jgi:2-amino-4-hydroxy-6-hydroxymethyldihydropteridine diphosphokinase